MNNIPFIVNFNGKLNNNVFTTIRKHKGGESNYYSPKIGSNYNVMLKENVIGTAKLLSARMLRFKEIPELVLLLDTGMSDYDNAVQVFEKFYGKFSHDELFYILFFEKVS
jgi:hypothetical protein